MIINDYQNKRFFHFHLISKYELWVCQLEKSEVLNLLVLGQ